MDMVGAENRREVGVRFGVRGRVAHRAAGRSKEHRDGGFILPEDAVAVGAAARGRHLTAGVESGPSRSHTIFFIFLGVVFLPLRRADVRATRTVSEERSLYHRVPRQSSGSATGLYFRVRARFKDEFRAPACLLCTFPGSTCLGASGSSFFRGINDTESFCPFGVRAGR